MVSSYQNGTDAAYQYEYDANGNITHIQQGDTHLYYQYDALNQLVREDNSILNKSITYTYDDRGNILNKTEYAYVANGGTLGAAADTITYGYESEYQAWADQLTSYDGEAIRYDASGNPTTYRGYTMAWQGRRLTGATNGTNTISYSYDENGIRTQKTVNGTVTNYNYHGSALISQVTGNDTLLFSYDANGNVAAVNYNGTYYYYVRNGQNDIIRLIDGESNTVVEYAYDSWGRQISCTGSLASTLGNLNPFRYRGYVYDAETGFYYVSSRYYDPEIGRFINADDIAYLGMGGLTSYNLFAYCGNNPVMGYDPYGTFDWSSFGKGAGWLAIGITAICVGVSVLTCGVAAPAMMAVAAVTVTAGALTAVNGVSELGEAATGHNFVRDDVFRGNEKAYDVYSNTTAAVAEIGTAICGGWTAKNAPRIKAYNNIQNYNYTDTISDVTHMSRPYANSVLTQKQVIKYGKMTKDSFGYVFSAMGSVNGKEKLWRLGINTAKGLVWHWGHGF